MTLKNKSDHSERCLSALTVLRGTYTRYRLLFLLMAGCLTFINSTYAQTVTVTGRVTESSGNPLPGVTIVIRGTSPTGTTTGEDGRYTLVSVPANAVLSFSFVGFKTQEIPVNGRTRIDVQLQEEATTLDEVIINAGYYTVKDQLRTGSIARVTTKEIENQPVSNALSTIQGRMAGVNITQGGGVPGGGYNVQIRGTNSLRRAGNYPMYIINGVPVSLEGNALAPAIMPLGEFNPLSAINPADIESIEILKDADATAIYGSRGSNGVILITTRKAKSGDKRAFSINSSYGSSKVASKMELMNTAQYLDMRRQAFANDGITNYPANAYDVNGTWDQDRYTDWQDELIGGTAVNSTVQLSVSGGSENTNFFISGSHNEHTTVFAKDFRYKTNDLSGSLNHLSSDNRLRLNASVLFSDQSNNLIQTDVTGRTLILPPSAPKLYNEDGSPNWENSTFANPVAAYVSTYSNKSKTINTSLNLNFEVLPSLYFILNGGMNVVMRDELSLFPHTRLNPAIGATPARSTASKRQRQTFSYIAEPQLNYKHRFNDHEIDILVGGTYQERENTELRLFGSGFQSNALITNITAATTITVNNDEKIQYKYAAIFGRINYQYKERYIFNLTGRRDGSSRFGPDNRFANFGAIGAAWLFSKENFLSDLHWLSFGKLRASYGITGSDLIGDYQYLDNYTVSSKLYGGISGLYPTRLFNPYFSWEKTTKREVAIETGFMKDRINLTAALYVNRSGNQLVGIPLPATTGFSTIQANLPATVENRGWELELNTTPVQTRQLTWDSNVNISFPRNKLVEFPGLEGSTYANSYEIGYPVSIMKVYNYEGIDNETGLYLFTDYNDDGSISSPDDNRVIEDVGPKCFGGWHNRVTYKGWEFSFLFQFVKQQQTNYNYLMLYPGTMNNQPVEYLDVWSEENKDGKYMPYTSGANPQKNQLLAYYRNSTAAVGDASFIRLKNVQFSYRLPVNRYIRDILFYAQGQNLLTLTNYFGLDPEFTTTGFLPPLKTYALGMQINF